MATALRIRMPGIAAVLGATALLALLAPGITRAESTFGSYSVTARSDLFKLELYDSRVPVIPPGQPAVELSPATAQARVDSLGTSAAFASAPYPGETVSGLPGLISALAGNDAPPLPRYPVLVASSYPTTEQDTVDQGVYTLDARSTQTSSGSRASFGGGSGEAFVLVTGQAWAEIEATTTAIRAESHSRVSGLVIPDVLELTDLETSSSIRIEPGEEPVPMTTFDTAVVTVAGVGLRVGPEGVTLADSLIPFGDESVAALLAEAGVGLEYVPEETGATEDGAVYARSAGLRVTYEVTGADGETDRIVYDLGRTFATADARPVPVVEFTPPVTPTPPPPAAPVGTTDGGVATGARVPPSVAIAPPPPRVEVPAPAAPDVAPPAGPSVTSPPAVVATGPIDPGPTLSGVYAMLALAAILAGGAGRLIGLLGVRLGPHRRVTDADV